MAARTIALWGARRSFEAKTEKRFMSAPLLRLDREVEGDVHDDTTAHRRRERATSKATEHARRDITGMNGVVCDRCAADAAVRADLHAHRHGAGHRGVP